MLGVAAIIIVMSVMNGFRSNLTERLIGVNSHLKLYSFDQNIENNEIEMIKKNLDPNSYYNIFSSIETQFTPFLSPKLPSSLTKILGIKNRLIPLAPGGASGNFA